MSFVEKTKDMSFGEDLARMSIEFATNENVAKFASNNNIYEDRIILFFSLSILHTALAKFAVNIYMKEEKERKETIIDSMVYHFCQTWASDHGKVNTRFFVRCNQEKLYLKRRYGDYRFSIGLHAMLGMIYNFRVRIYVDSMELGLEAFKKNQGSPFGPFAEAVHSFFIHAYGDQVTLNDSCLLDISNMLYNTFKEFKLVCGQFDK